MRSDGLKLKSETEGALLCWLTPKQILEFQQMKKNQKVLPNPMRRTLEFHSWEQISSLLEIKI